MSFDDLPLELRFEIYKYCDFMTLINIKKIGYYVPDKIISDYKYKRQIIPYIDDTIKIVFIVHTFNFIRISDRMYSSPSFIF